MGVEIKVHSSSLLFILMRILLFVYSILVVGTILID